MSFAIHIKFIVFGGIYGKRKLWREGNIATQK